MMDEITSRLADRLARERETRRWSLSDLSQRSGVSRAMISKIERGEASPTAALLGKLSGAFGLTMSSLLATVEAPVNRLRRADEQPLWRDPDTGYMRRAVSPPNFGALDIVAVSLPVGARVSYPASSYSFIRQQILVQAGCLHFAEGEQLHVLASGDCLELGDPADCTFSNPGPDPCHYLVIVATR